MVKPTLTVIPGSPFSGIGWSRRASRPSFARAGAATGSASRTAAATRARVRIGDLIGADTTFYTGALTEVPGPASAQALVVDQPDAFEPDRQRQERRAVEDLELGEGLRVGDGDVVDRGQALGGDRLPHHVTKLVRGPRVACPR